MTPLHAIMIITVTYFLVFLIKLFGSDFLILISRVTSISADINLLTQFYLVTSLFQGFGIRYSEFGIRNSEFGMANCIIVWK